jgi:two-component system, OmpR family, phosphate regulon sensor histidine kinase PhoR
VQLRHDNDPRSIAGALGALLARAAERIRRRAPLLLAAAVAGGVCALLAGLSPWLFLLGAGLVLGLAALVGLDDDDDGTAGAGHHGRLGQTEPLGGWRAALNAVPDPVLALDDTGMILHVNPAARELHVNARVGGQPSLLTRDPEFLQAIDEVLDDGRQRTVEVQERVPIDRRVRITLTALPDGPAHEPTDGNASGSPPRVIMVLHDLTEQDRLGRMRVDFVANASHELRTPLASLVGFIETLQGRASDDPAARERFLGIMSQQAARMSRLVEDLLSLSRVEMREHVPPRTAIDLNETVGAAMQALEPVARASGATLALSLCEGPAIVLGETDEIVQVVHNLVQNGLKYGRPGGTVGVTVHRLRQGPTMRLAVAVRDDGPGIAPDHLPRLTERFYRVNAKSSREKGGTGLGLAIVKHIANRHRGELTIASELGQGSTFTFVIDEQARRPSESHVSDLS